MKGTVSRHSTVVATQDQVSSDLKGEVAILDLKAGVYYGLDAVGARICLTDALAAQTMLARRGHPALLRIGLTKDEESRLQAHAWVESAGKVVIGGSADLEHYTLLPALDGEKP